MNSIEVKSPSPTFLLTFNVTEPSSSNFTLSRTILKLIVNLSGLIPEEDLWIMLKKTTETIPIAIRANKTNITKVTTPDNERFDFGQILFILITEVKARTPFFFKILKKLI